LFLALLLLLLLVLTLESLFWIFHTIVG
jgi:hypothetical protein